MHFEGDTKLERYMANVHALRKMWTMNGEVYTAVQRMYEDSKEIVDELVKLRNGSDEMRVELEDGVALVCAMLGVHAVKNW